MSQWWNAELERLAALEPGWDSYSAPKIGPLARAQVRTILKFLEENHLPLEATQLVPGSDGGIAIVWDTNVLGPDNNDTYVMPNGAIEKD